MKRLHIILTILLAAAMLTACTRETSSGAVQGATMTGDGEVIVDEEEEISE